MDEVAADEAFDADDGAGGPDDGGGDGVAPAAGAGQGWWRRRPARTRRLLGAAAAVLVSGVVAVVVGVTTAETDGSLGPHEARYSVTVDRAVTVDLGPLGSLVLDSPLPRPLGVRVVVGEIPGDLAAVAANPNLALAGDLDGYLQFFTAPDVALRTAALDLGADAARRTVLAWSLLLLLVAAGRLASPTLLRAEVREMLERPGVGLLVGAVALGATVVPVVAVGAQGNSEGREIPVLAGTPLADARVVGRLGDFIDAYGAVALDAVEQNDAFYAEAAANLAAAYEADPTPLAPTAPADEVDGETTTAPTEATAPTDATPPPGDVAVSAGVTPSPEEATPSSVVPTGEPEDLVTALLISDLHCNVGMTEVVGEAVRRSGARVVLNAGDTVIAGTSVEQFCVDALARAIPEEVPVVVADGNHDSELTAEQERAVGHVVLAGEPVVVAGVRILGDVEPTLTTVAEGTRLKGEETRAQVGERLARRACEARDADEPIDVLLVHNPRAGVAAMATGCVPLQLSGHMHSRMGPMAEGLGLLYISSSTAGAQAGKQTIGPLNGPAAMTVIRFDPVAHRPVDYRILTVGNDATVDLGPWETFPEPPAEVVEPDLGDPVPDY